MAEFRSPKHPLTKSRKRKSSAAGLSVIEETKKKKKAVTEDHAETASTKTKADEDVRVAEEPVKKKEASTEDHAATASTRTTADVPVNEKLRNMLKWYGDKTLTVAYEVAALGYIWIFDWESGMGFVRIHEPEWGSVDLENDIMARRKDNTPLYMKPIRIFRNELPCTFQELVEKCPWIDTYFQDNV